MQDKSEHNNARHVSELTTNHPQRGKLCRQQMPSPQGKLRGVRLKWPWNSCPVQPPLPAVTAGRHNTRRLNWSTCPASGSPPGTCPASTAAQNEVNVPAERIPLPLILSAGVFLEVARRGRDDSRGSEMTLALSAAAACCTYSCKICPAKRSKASWNESFTWQFVLILLPYSSFHLDLGQSDKTRVSASPLWASRHQWWS